ncbi:MAG: hypothetical protein M1541_02360, partial [Acidobacteria bacterium]|nr:hypothetical protein [Acidobacteriota bacterium]
MAAYLVLIAVFCGRLAAQSPSLDSEIRRIDSAAENPQNKMVVVAAEADQLKMHRNHLMLLRRQTGKSYGQIFVSTLKSAGQNDDVILEQARVLNRE